MEVLAKIFSKLEEVYGSDVAIRAVCTGGCLFFLCLVIFLKPQQPVLIINEPIQNNQKGE